MPTRYTVVCSDGRAGKIRRLAEKNNVTEEEVLRQLVDIGLDTLDTEREERTV